MKRASAASAATAAPASAGQPGADGRPRILLMSHSHPLITHGGAEISAYALFKALKDHDYPTWFVGCSGPASENRAGVPFAQPYGPLEYVYHESAPFDHFKFANPDPKFPSALEELLVELRPDIVHLHHYSRFGVETFRIIKRALPRAKVVLSLHEFLAICNHNGQMVKTGDLRLCYEATFSACAACFRDRGARDFFLRKRYLTEFLDDVDKFVSPSIFLADRYVAWGVRPQKMTVLENLPATLPASRARQETKFDRDDTDDDGTAPARRVRVGFFGQMSPLKGIVVLIEAANRLEEMEIENLSIDIHGDYSNQPPEYQAAVTKALADAGKNVVYHGPYENAQVQRLMGSVDVVVTPSIWWENSPLVIQEAFTAGKPVVCSDIGGMAEKVRHGVNGLHFEAGSSRHLAEILARFARKPSLLDELSASVTAPPGPDASLSGYIELYANLMQN